MTVAQRVEEDVDGTIRRLKAKRRRLGLSLADVGKLIGVHRNTIYRWESRVSKPPVPKFLEWKREIDQRIAEAEKPKQPESAE